MMAAYNSKQEVKSMERYLVRKFYLFLLLWPSLLFTFCVFISNISNMGQKNENMTIFMFTDDEKGIIVKQNKMEGIIF